MNKKIKEALRKTANHAERFAKELKSGDVESCQSYNWWRYDTYGNCPMCTASGDFCECCPIEPCMNFIPKGLKTDFEDQGKLTKRSYRVRWFEQTAEDLREMANSGNRKVTISTTTIRKTRKGWLVEFNGKITGTYCGRKVLVLADKCNLQHDSDLSTNYNEWIDNAYYLMELANEMNRKNTKLLAKGNLVR